NIILPPGQYTYTIKYKMENQVGLYRDHDEIYWNVTGNDWDFVINEASATVNLPNGARILKHTGYSGNYGSKDCTCCHLQHADNVIHYKMTQPLKSGEGLTIAIGWNKGIILKPTILEKLKQKHYAFFESMFWALMVLLYYAIVWLLVGRDPKKGTVIPRF